MRIAATPAEALAILQAFVDDPNRQRPAGVPDLYEGCEPDEYDNWSQRDLDALADRRADQMFGGA